MEFNDILNDIRVKVADEFDRNFTRKAFFNEKWQKRKRSGRGSLMVGTGRLRRSLTNKVKQNSIVFSSSAPYASIHNDGGIIEVTPKMRSYFWATYYKHIKGVSYSIKERKLSSVRSERKNTEAEYYKALAMSKKLNIPQRQFIGHHQKIDNHVKRIFNSNISQHTKDFLKNLKP